MKRSQLKAAITTIPQKPGVYLFKGKAGRIIYIGKAKNLKKRVGSYFKTSYGNNSPQPPLMLRGGVTDIDWIQTKNESQALLLENQLIKKYQPRHNIQWRDDKSYFWVRFTQDQWARVTVVHRNEINPSQPPFTKRRSSPPLEPAPDLIRGGVGGDFFGPFVSGKELRKTLRALRKILPYRTCKNPYEKPCLQWHLGLCPAHKNGLSQIAYSESLRALSQFLRLYVGEKIRIEAYDISNIQGKYATGSMIVFYGNKSSKSDYRKFRIKTVHGANDVAMISEVLRRRLGHPEWPMPDLMLIDGGIAQLSAASLTLNPPPLPSPLVKRGGRRERVSVIALAKRQEEIYTEYSNKPLKISQLPESLRLILQAIRDEAHRFAIFYYRHLHEKRGFGKSRAEIRKTRSNQRKA